MTRCTAAALALVLLLPATAVPAQAVTFLSPAGGEIWQAGSVHTIRWTVDSPTTDTVSLCRFDALNIENPWALVANVPLGSGAFDWTAYSPSGPSYQTQLALVPLGNCWGASSSMIAGSGWFWVTAGETAWVDLYTSIFSTQQVTGWGPISFQVDVYNRGPYDAPGATLAVPVPDQLLSMTWQCTPSVGSSCPPAGRGSVQGVVDVRAGGTLHYVFQATVGADAIGSRATFPVTAVVAPPASRVDTYPYDNSKTLAFTVLDARVVSPNGGEISAIGSSRTLRWLTSQATGSVDVAFVQGGTTTPIATVAQTTTDGSMTWTVPSTPGAGRIAVVWSSFPGGKRDESDADFAIVDPAPPPKPLDLNGDGKADILWHHQTTGELYAWFLDGMAVTAGSYLTPPAFTDTRWQIRAIADLDGDGKADILWHHQETGDLYVWLMDGTVVTGGSYLTPRSFADTRWQIRGVADFNSDGQPDILWRQQQTGELYVWLMSGLTVTGGSYLTPPSLPDPLWQIRSVTDLNRDGKADVLWHHQGTGDLYVWYLDGTMVTRGAYLTPGQFADTRWQIRRVDDFDGDGQPDVLWHHQTTGELYVWLLDGSVASRGSYLVPDRFADTRWQIVPR